MWPEYWPLIGQSRSHVNKIAFWLVDRFAFLLQTMMKKKMWPSSRRQYQQMYFWQNLTEDSYFVSWHLSFLLHSSLSSNFIRYEYLPLRLIKLPVYWPIIGCQAWKLKRQYVKEWENWMEILVLSAAIVTMACKHVSIFSYWSLLFMWAEYWLVLGPQVLLGSSLMSDIVRGVSALGICFAWLELILLIGRYPFKGGDFSIMFYRIIKRLFRWLFSLWLVDVHLTWILMPCSDVRYIFALFLMILGHAFAFMVINYGIEKDSFESPWKSFVMTITMALGEFQVILASDHVTWILTSD